MIKIRKGVFETNSSSTHSLSVCSLERWKQFEKNKLYYNFFQDIFYTEEQLMVKNNLKTKSELKKYCKEEGWYTIDGFRELSYETFEEIVRTPKGEKIMIFGYYGYN